MGGGNSTWITQSKPTRFHEFWKQKVLSPDESLADYKEVPISQKLSMENKDADDAKDFELMDTDFLSRCKEWFGRTFTTQSYGTISADWRYNEESGYFEFGSLNDITYTQMRIALDYSIYCRSYGGNLSGNGLGDKALRFAIIQYRTSYPASVLSENSGIESILMAGTFGSMPRLNSMASTTSSFFRNATKLKEILGRLSAQYLNTSLVFTGCSSLAEVRIELLNGTLDFSSTPYLSLASIEYMITHSAGESQLILHPKVYAKITGEDTNLSDEEKEQWIALIPLAQTKNIIFVSA